MKLITLCFLVPVLFAQADQPQISNARLESRKFQGNLRQQVRSNSPAWFGYSVKAISGQSRDCCWNGHGRCGVRLEVGSPEGAGTGSKSPVLLETDDRVSVLIRVDSAGIGKVETYSLNCPLDGGNLPFIWIEDVPEKASLTFLNGVVRGTANDRIIDGALAAIAQHQDEAADRLLESFTESSQPQKLREKSIFWLGANRGARGVPVLKNLLANDGNEHIRDKAVFALSISKQPAALDAILEAAKNDSSAHVRGQALFWLAQKAGARAAGAIVDAIQNDPDTQVKERAVFALSQLPKDEGIPRLIQVASEQRNPRVKKQAFFWLGQSGDPRALSYIEKILTK